MQDETFKDHPVWESFNTVSQAAVEVDGSEDAADVASRVRQIAAYVARFRSGVPAALFSKGMLDKAVPPLDQLRAQLQQAAQAQQPQRPAHVQQAHAQADAVLAVVAGWPQPVNAISKSAAATEQFTELSRLMDEAAAGHRARVEELQGEMETIQSQKEGLQARLDELEASIKSRSEEVSRIASDQSDHFTKAQSARAAEHDEVLSSRRDEWGAFLTEQQTAAKGLLDDMEGIKAKTKGVAGDTSSAVLARSFGDYSQRDFISGVVSFGVGLLIVVATLGVLVLDLSGVEPDQPLSWSWSLLKLGLVSTAIGAAAVLFRVGQGFLGNSRANKRTELELRSIGLFLEGLDKDGEQAREAKLQWLGRTFSPETPDKDAPTPESRP